MTRTRLLILLGISVAVGTLNPALAGLIDAQQSRSETTEREAVPAPQKSRI